MENIKEIVRENLIKFRKERKLTQMELATKIKYSDKAVSRWENGDVTPDIETLNMLSEVYNIPISYFFEKHDKSKNFLKIKKLDMGNKTAIALLSIVCVWFIATLGFVYLQMLFNINYWMFFVWAVPASCIVAIVFNSIWGERKWTFVFSSILTWTLIAAIYLQLLRYNLYLIFILGVPLQIGTILGSYIKPHHKDDHKDQMY